MVNIIAVFYSLKQAIACIYLCLSSLSNVTAKIFFFFVGVKGTVADEALSFNREKLTIHQN